MLSQVGTYKIERELGRGGMGEVYLARDTKLDRQVAIKALPAHLGDDPDRLSRFQREAKVLASLNHPNIGAIYGLEEVAGHQYLVLEYIEGETLSDRLKSGPIPIDEALPIARQVAEALEAAHEKGVIHRDLKPGNVMVNAEGHAKVLDFGLARTADGTPSSSSYNASVANSPTVTSPMPVHSPTIPGVIMGTAGYMSPEQARGKPVDKRSDIFSFGCVLYEMLTGSQPFSGETATDSIGAILHRDPAWAMLPPGTPARVRELLTNCLAKDRKQRLHDMGDARLELERAIAGHEWTTTAPQASRRTRLLLASLCTLAGAALIGIGWLLASRLAPPVQRAPATAKLLIPSRAAPYCWAENSLISPDGRSVAFSARSTDTGQRSLWVRPINSFDARPLAETTGARIAFWSPDSRSIAFQAEGKLWAVSVEQAGSRRLIAAMTELDGGSWGPDGTILVARSMGGPEGNGGIFKVPASGGKPEPVTTVDTKAFERGHAFPTFLPDGRRFLYLVIDRKPDQEVSLGHLYAGSLDSHERTFIADITSHAWYVDPGWLVYVDDGTIKGVPFDLKSLRITGEAVTIADGVSYFRPIGWSSLTVAADGAMAFEPPADEQQMVWFDAAGVRLGTVGPKGSFGGARISPDGTRVVVSVGDRRTGLTDLWIYGVGRASSSRLTADTSWEGAPVWSPDGSIVYYSSDKNDYPEVFSIRADGSGDIQKLYGPGSGGRVWFPHSVSPDGKVLMISGTVEKLDSDLRILPLDGSSVAAPFRSTPAGEDGGRFSPDGHWIAYRSNESGKPEVYIAPYPGPGPKVQVSEGGFSPVWSPTGDKLYYIQAKSGSKAGSDPSRVMVVDLSEPAAFKSPPPPKVLFENADDIGDLDVAPDGKRFLLQIAPVETPPIRVILNGLPSARENARPAAR